MTQPVPTNGFNVPPAGAPAVPQSQTPAQVTTPPGTNPGNGEPVVLPGQVPGYVPRTQAEPAKTDAPAQPAAMDAASIQALIQQALGQKSDAPPAQTEASSELPAWAKEGLDKFDVTQLDDPILKSMATIMQTVGKDLDLNRVLGRALSYSDVNLIDVAYLQERGGANAAQLAEIARGLVQAVAAKGEQITQSVYALAGGEAGWTQAVTLFNSSAPQELKLTVQQMLDSTNQQFITAGAKIVAQFGKQSGAVPSKGAPMLQAAAGNPGGQGLDLQGFRTALQQLDKNAASYEADREALFSRRKLGKAAGLN